MVILAAVAIPWGLPMCMAVMCPRDTSKISFKWWKRKGLGAYLCYLGFVSSKTSGFVTGIFDPRWKVHVLLVSPGSLEQLRSGMTKCNVCFLHAGNTRVIKQSSLQKFQEEMETVMKDPYRVIMKQKKLPMSLFYDRIKPHVGITRCAGVCTELPGQ